MAHTVTKTHLAKRIKERVVQTAHNICHFMYGDEQRTKYTLTFAYGCMLAALALHFFSGGSGNACVGTNPYINL